MASVEYIARAIIEEDERILLCHGKGRENWFFPGGHIEEGESAPEALLRELAEELGVTGVVERFWGACENKFERDGEVTHEINLVFAVALDQNGADESREAHLEFAWFTRDEMADMLVFPLSLRDAVLVPQREGLVWASEGF